MFIAYRKWNKLNLTIIIITILIIFYNELYLYHAHNWKQLKCKDEGSCVRILLIADPQLIGLNNEMKVITPVSIWDSDRYLKKTYGIALSFTKPHIVIYLGDIFDEGSRATEPEYKSYMYRFFSIFSIDLSPSNSIKHIFIPGDNDIGGEGTERITRNNILRFEQAFMQPTIMSVRNLTFYKINRLTNSIPQVNVTKDFFNLNEIRIGLSHMPLMFMPSTFVDKAFKSLQPHLLFTAHEHKSMIISTDGLIQKDRQIIPISKDEIKDFEFTLGITDMYEINVPTCSYRMGTNQIGYGYAIIENGELRYTVLWSPTRFPQLATYAVLAVLAYFYFLIKLCQCYKRKQTINNKNKYFV